MFTVNNKNARTTSMTSFWCFHQLGACFTSFSSVSIVDFEQVNANWLLWNLYTDIITIN